MTEPLTSTGVLFVATGDKYVSSASRCARSIKKYTPDLAIHLFTDKPNADRLLGQRENPFSSITEIETPHRRSKVEFIGSSPFDRTLFLDSDTDVVVDIREMFTLLDRFDIALAHAPKRNENKSRVFWKQPLPASFPQFNSGVILYRKNSLTRVFFQNWLQAYQQAGFKIDQITLRECLWASDLRIATLPPEYNLRFTKYKYLWNHLEAKPKIYHLSKFHSSFWRRIVSPFYRLYKLARYYGSNLRHSIGRKQ